MKRKEIKGEKERGVSSMVCNLKTLREEFTERQRKRDRESEMAIGSLLWKAGLEARSEKETR